MLLGTELNICDYDGNIDMPEKTLAKMDIAIASMHIPCIKPGTKEQNTQAYIKVMENPYVNIIGHPDDARFPVDYLALVQAAKEHGVLLEVNNNSLDPRSTRQGGAKNVETMLRYCMQYETPVVVNSDAHTDMLIANHLYAEKIMESVGFPEELVVNRSVNELKKYLKRYEKISL